MKAEPVLLTQAEPLEDTALFKNLSQNHFIFFPKKISFLFKFFFEYNLRKPASAPRKKS